MAAVLLIPSILKRILLPENTSQLQSRPMQNYADHGTLLPYNMTPSSDSWSMKSLLLSSFFVPEIECNMVSTWLNPVVAVINSLLKEGNTPKLAAILGRRQPEIAPLWLGAITTGQTRSFLGG